MAVVVCQYYTAHIVQWDRSMAFIKATKRRHWTSTCSDSIQLDIAMPQIWYILGLPCYWTSQAGWTDLYSSDDGPTGRGSNCCPPSRQQWRRWDKCPNWQGCPVNDLSRMLGNFYGPWAPSTDHNGCGYLKKPTLEAIHGRGCHKTSLEEDWGYIFPWPPVLCLYATWWGIHGGGTLNVHHLFHNDKHCHVSWEGDAVYGRLQRELQMRTDYPAPPKCFQVENMFCHWWKRKITFVVCQQPVIIRQPLGAIHSGWDGSQNTHPTDDCSSTSGSQFVSHIQRGSVQDIDKRMMCSVLT